MDALLPVCGLLDRFLGYGSRFDEQFVVYDLTLPYVRHRVPEKDVALFVDALLTVLPPWEGVDILLPLERLGFSFAYGTVMLAFSGTHDWTVFIRNAGRFAALVHAELQRREAFGHQLCTQVMNERTAAWTVAVHALKDLAHGDPNNKFLGVLVERLIAIGCYKGSLLEQMIVRQYGKSPRKTRERLRSRINFGIAEGMAHPWQPRLTEEDTAAGIDIIVTVSLPAADCRKLFGLLLRVVSRELILDTSGPPEFVNGLIANLEFRRSSERVPYFVKTM